MKIYFILCSSFVLFLIISNCNFQQIVTSKQIYWENEFPSIRYGATSIDIFLELSQPATVYYIISEFQLSDYSGDSIRKEVYENQNLYENAGSIIVISFSTIYIAELKDNQNYYIYFAVENGKSEIIDTLTKQITCKLNQRLTPVSFDDTSAPFGYYLYLPENYYKYPEIESSVILFLHGIYHRGNGMYNSENTDDSLYQLPRVLTIRSGFTGGLATDLLTTDYPSVVIVPQCPEDIYWDYNDLDEMVNYIISIYNIDSKQVYLTGLSMGGGATWVYALDHADKLAAIVPICGYEDVNSGDRLTRLGNLINMPIWAFHNELDSQLPVSLTYDWINEIKNLQQPSDTEPLMTIYETGEGINDHDAWTRAYHDQDLLNWLFEQVKE